MNIVIGKENVKGLDDRYIILEMDQFKLPNSSQIIDTYCVVENVPLHEIATIENSKKLHSDLISNYRNRNWNFCEDAIKHLQGKWNKEVDTFYENLLDRIGELKTQDLDQDWNGVVCRKQS